MHRKTRSDLMLRRRFNLVDILVILVLIVGLALILVGPSRIDWSGISAFDSSTPESQDLKRAYGPGSNSEHEEEWIIRDYFQGRRDGVFIDVGANHYQKAQKHVLFGDGDGLVRGRRRAHSVSLKRAIQHIDREPDSSRSSCLTGRTDKPKSMCSSIINS